MRAISSFAFLTIVAACSGASGSAPDGLSVSTTVTPAEFRAGDRASVHVVVTNTSIFPRTITTNACPDVFVVESADGRVVGPGEQVCTLQLEQTTLKPGDQFSWTQDWTGDGVSGEINGAAVFLPPGTYTVRARIVASAAGNSGAKVTIVP